MILLYVGLIVVVVTFAIKALNGLRRIHKNRKMLETIPAPTEKFFFGHLHIIMDEADAVFYKIRSFSTKYYPIYRFSTPYFNVVHLLEPNDIELVLSSTKHLTKSKVYTYLQKWLGTGLLTSTGSKWHNRRKILTPAFHFNILQEFITVFNEETAKLAEVFSNNCDEIVNVVPTVTNFTLQSIGETAMGLDNIDHETRSKYKQAIYEMGRILLTRLSKPWYGVDIIYKLSDLSKRESSVIKVLHAFSNSIIRRREAEMSTLADPKPRKKRLAMLDLLLSAKADGFDIDHEGIREEVDTFMFEGHDTTAMAISFLFLVLANLQDIQDKIFEDILSVLGPTKVPTYDDLQNLKYTERCIKETLRLFPSVHFISRVAGETFTTRTGHRIPEGTFMDIHIFDIHRNEKLYPQPLKFDPDRFLPENMNRRHPFAYVPFSAGPRNCIGQRFAFLELKCVLCGILRKFKLEKVDGWEDVEFKADMVLRPKKDIRVRVSSRNVMVPY